MIDLQIHPQESNSATFETQFGIKKNNVTHVLHPEGFPVEGLVRHVQSITGFLD